jgi:diguanylate cyclase (GGDEF)-like protein/PAS domain S-box-containing protein
MNHQAKTNTELIEELSSLKQRIQELEHSDSERKRSGQELVIIAEIGRLIGSTLNIDEVYERFTVETQKLIPIDSLTVNLYNFQENTLCVAYVSGLDIDGRRQGDNLVLKGSLSEAVIRTRTSLCIQPASIDEIVSQFPRLTPIFQAGLRSIMCVPLVYRDKVIAVLHFRSKKQNAYTEKDILLAERIGMQIVGAMANAQLYSGIKKTENSLRESEGRFRGLVKQAAVGVAEIIMETGQFITVNRRLYEMVDRTEAELLATTFLAITHPEDSHLHEEKTQMMLAGEIDHYSLEKRYLRKDGIIVWVNITVSPLWKHGEAPGRSMIVVEDITDRKLMEEALKDRERRYRELSIIDDLTQLYNSRHFYFQLKIEMDRSNRYGNPLTLLLLDLDNFKHFNDTYGHVEGDHVLIRLGQVFKRCLRETDFAYRYGGEEFTILLPMTTIEDGAVTAERIRTEFKKETFSPAPDQDIHKTVSIGLAQYKPQEDMKDFVHRVDQFMYQGKKNGKDRVCCGS